MFWDTKIKRQSQPALNALAHRFYEDGRQPMKSEAEIQQEIQLEAAKYGIVLERNNSGAFNDGSRMIFFGLGNISKKKSENIKSSDLIACTPVTITQEMVGKTIGVFTAIEVKSEDWRSDKKLDKREQAQKNYIDWIKSKGGIAGFANSVDSFKKLLGL